MDKKTVKKVGLCLGGLALLCVGAAAFASNTVGIQVLANNVRSNLTAIADLITAGSYVGGMGFGVGAIVKFKAHKDQPTQNPIGVPIAMLFVSAALMFIPSVFQSSGQTLFGTSGGVAGTGGISSFGVKVGGT